MLSRNPANSPIYWQIERESKRGSDKRGGGSGLQADCGRRAVT